MSRGAKPRRRSGPERILIVDGYNVLNARRHLEGAAALADAREKLLAELKERGVWVIGADMDGQKLSETDLTGATALVIGAEGEGISRLVKDECELTVALPMRGHIDSLNASVAAGVLMYAVRTARGD